MDRRDCLAHQTNLLADLLDDVTEHGEEALEEARQVVQHVDERHRVQDRDPTHQQLPDVPGISVVTILTSRLVHNSYQE